MYSLYPSNPIYSIQYIICTYITLYVTVYDNNVIFSYWKNSKEKKIFLFCMNLSRFSIFLLIHQGRKCVAFPIPNHPFSNTNTLTKNINTSIYLYLYIRLFITVYVYVYLQYILCKYYGISIQRFNFNFSFLFFFLFVFFFWQPFLLC